MTSPTEPDYLDYLTVLERVGRALLKEDWLTLDRHERWLASLGPFEAIGLGRGDEKRELDAKISEMEDQESEVQQWLADHDVLPAMRRYGTDYFDKAQFETTFRQAFPAAAKELRTSVAALRVRAADGAAATRPAQQMRAQDSRDGHRNGPKHHKKVVAFRKWYATTYPNGTSKVHKELAAEFFKEHGVTISPRSIQTALGGK